ncbi:pyridoxamine 5'-phosphate oxidase family protein [Streptomyces sp. DSM 44915]|uniref:Pyridoxamine 5'-phosphate oxidase family protein n=1 Tax=Streptomyces chisholmiae TaxID=3075540 RepID=A0ABU2JQG5_9ACTN|nr:pyridoxamine 5'-phosphate oxidase family protein [Streptomyces sp. DSM 44915]MDT0266764.1 pyridoxamine 5'-phosphate oxidase family protein [Streptomyces sp. DSM 44915]
MTTDYHPGERGVQRRAGALARADHAQRAIRDRIPEVAAGFLAGRTTLVVGARDAAGRVWASQLTGPAGFVTAPDERTVAVRAAPDPDDPLAEVLTAAGETPVGAVAVEPATRRRMRVNGWVRPAEGELRLRVAQVYANCPRHITRRVVTHLAPAARRRPPVRVTPALTPAQQALVAAADTCFVASGDLDGSMDASHRGGPPGFLRVTAPDLISWPDYRGNAMYMTLGNLARDPRAGLLVVDWADGTLLHLTGRARVDWSPARAAALDGAERMVDFQIERVLARPAASALRWATPDPADAH